MNAIETVEAPDLKSGLPRLAPGDTVRVHVRVKETSVKEEKGKAKETERERLQVFEGVVIGIRGTGARRTMTVRCKTDVEAAKIGYDQIKELYFQNPQFGFKLLHLIVARMVANTEAKHAAKT